MTTSLHTLNRFTATGLLLLSLSLPVSAQPLFSSSTFSPTGESPHAAVVADFNGDGKQDLATANAKSNDVRVLLGIGAGRFTPAPGGPTPAGMKPQSLAAGDFDGDSRLDLATANADSNTLTVLVGDGTGAFTPIWGSPFTVGSNPGYVVTADFNADGRLDLAIANAGSNNVSVLLGSLDGFYAPSASPFAVGANPRSIAVGDFNSDGRPDMAIANAGSNTVTVLQGNGAGGFAAAPGSPLAAGRDPQSVAAADLNGDGKPDLAVASATDNTLTLLLGNGFGAFSPAAGSPVAVTPNPVWVTTGDFNADGRMDLATANASDGTLTVLLGNGTGSVAAAPGRPLAVGLSPSSVAAGDLNGDGRLDLAAAIAGESSIAILLNSLPARSSTFREAAGNPFSLGRINSATFTATADFNRDGRRDVVVVGEDSENVAVLLGNSAGGFSTAPGSPFAVGGAPSSIALGDFNRDGKPDFATANSEDDTVTVLLGNGAGGFSTAPGSPFRSQTRPESLVTADLNADGKLDLAIANNYSHSVTVLLGDGGGGFAQGPGSPFRAGSFPNTVTAGDFNGDGTADLAVLGETLAVLLGNGVGEFSWRIYELPAKASAASLGDFNSDGKLDIAAIYPASGRAGVLLGDGAGTFSPAPAGLFIVGDTPQQIAIGDLNGDGNLDLVVSNRFSSNVALFHGDGTGGFVPVPGSPVSTGFIFGSVALADFNGDGRLDVAAGEHPNKLRLLLNTALQSIQVSPATASVRTGGTQQFTATGTYADNSTLDLTAFVSWSSSAPVIAAFGNSPGVATGVSGGPATITTALGGLSATASLTVTGPVLQSIVVSPATASLRAGATQQFTAAARYSDGSTKDVTAIATWSSSDPRVVSISNAVGTQGVATGVSGGGPVTITATLVGASRMTAGATVTVTAEAQSSKPAIWGMNAARQIYRLSGDVWTLLPAPLGKLPSQVSVSGDGTVWALDSDGGIFDWRNSTWQMIPGALRQLSVGTANNVWGINQSNTIYRWNGSAWAQVAGPVNRTLKEVSAAMDGTVWSLDTDGNIYAYTGSGWKTMSGQLAQVSVGSRSDVWGVNASGGIFHWNGSSWTSVTGPANRIPKQVSVGANGAVYLIDSLGDIYMRSGSTWQQLSGQLVQISAG